MVHEHPEETIAKLRLTLPHETAGSEGRRGRFGTTAGDQGLGQGA